MNYTGFILLLLVFVRIISFIGSSTIFSIKGVPGIAKVGLGFVLSLLIFNLVKYDPKIISGSLISLLASGASECLFGLILGFTTSLIFYGIQAGGQFMDIQVGFSMASEFDSMSSTNVTLIGNLTNFVGICIFFIINGHHVLIQCIIKSFDIVQVGGLSLNGNIFQYIISLILQLFGLSLRIAAPVLITVFLTDFTMGLISRTVPQLNLLMLGLPVKMLGGLLVLSAAMPWIVHECIAAFQQIPKNINSLFGLFPLVIFFASGEKTEEPTQKKLEDTRKKGQTAKSREFVSAVTLIGIIFVAASLGGAALNEIENFLSRDLSSAGSIYLNQDSLKDIFMYYILEFAKITLPLFLTVVVLGILANLAQTGFMHSMEPIKPKFERINPINGFKRMFSSGALIELLKSIGNIAVVGYIAVTYIISQLQRIVSSSDGGVNSLLSIPAGIAKTELIRVAVAVCVIGALDFIYQKYSFKKEMMMTKQEVKEELKQTEGDPQIKSRLRRKQREIANRRMMHEVPKATVVITNPTHIAVALIYERKKDAAPKVVAKGVDEIAQRIKQVARDNNVPIIENKPVARMLYQKVEIDEAIPVEMYQVVAEILAVVYSIKRKRR